MTEKISEAAIGNFNSRELSLPASLKHRALDEIRQLSLGITMGQKLRAKPVPNGKRRQTEARF